MSWRHRSLTKQFFFSWIQNCCLTYSLRNDGFWDLRNQSWSALILRFFCFAQSTRERMQNYNENCWRHKQPFGIQAKSGKCVDEMSSSCESDWTPRLFNSTKKDNASEKIAGKLCNFSWYLKLNGEIKLMSDRDAFFLAENLCWPFTGSFTF